MVHGRLLILGVLMWSGAVMAQIGQVGSTFPDFNLLDLQGNSHSLGDYSGQALLLFLLTPT